MTPDNWKLVLAFGGLFLTTVTGPILWMLRAESKRISAELDALRSDVKSDMVGLKSDLKADHTVLKADVRIAITELKGEMAAMEARLNERIDTRLVHR